MTLDEGYEGESQRYVHSVARAITKGDPHAAEDLAQDVFLISLVKSPRDESRRRPWLRAITRNTLRYARFKDAVQPRQLNDTETELRAIPGRELDPAVSITRAEIASGLQELLLELPEKQREIVRLRAIEGLGPGEVAARLGVPVETVRTRYRRSLVALRQAADRRVGEDAVREWQPPAFLAWIWPKRVALSAIGLTSMVLVGAVWLWNREAALDAPEALQPVEAPGKLAAAAPTEDVNALPSAERVHAMPTLARAELLLSADGEPMGATELVLRSAPGEVVVGQTDANGSLELEGLEPGRWTAWHQGRPIDSKTLESGANPWELEVALRRTIKVRVVDREGQPKPLIEVHRLDDATNRTEPLGLTDAAGFLEAHVPFTGSWVAARGNPGASSAAAYLDQPMVEDHGGALQLVLEDHPVSWHQVRFPGDVPAESRVVVARHFRPTTTTGQLLGRGMRRSSVWLPPWRRSDGAYGVRPEQGVTLIAHDEAGEPWWISREHRLTHPLEPILDAHPPLAVAGRLVDVEGLPLAGLEVAVVGGATYGMTSLKAATDRDGRFLISGCPGDLVRLRSEYGRQAQARRPAEGEVVDIGPWEIRRVTLDVRIVGSQGPWKCTLFRTGIRKGLPELNPSLVDFTYPVFAAPGEEALRVEIPREIVGATILIERGVGADARATLVKRPGRGWVEGPLTVDLTDAHPVQLHAQLAMDRFPVRAVWIEEDSLWTSPALADPESGLVRSAPLPSGRWSLRLVDRLSLTARSEVATVAAGERHDFGVLRVDAGRARVRVPGAGLGKPSKGGRLQVDGVDSLFSATEFIPAGELAPLEITTELPAGQFRFALSMNGEVPAVGEATVEEGFIADVDLSQEQMFVGLGCANLLSERVSGASLKLLDAEGNEVWRESVPDQGDQLGHTMWFDVPRIVGTRLCTALSDGAVVPDLLHQLETPGVVLLPFEEWRGTKQ